MAFSHRDLWSTSHVTTQLVAGPMPEGKTFGFSSPPFVCPARLSPSRHGIISMHGSRSHSLSERWSIYSCATAERAERTFFIAISRCRSLWGGNLLGIACRFARSEGRADRRVAKFDRLVAIGDGGGLESDYVLSHRPSSQEACSRESSIAGPPPADEPHLAAKVHSRPGWRTRRR
jgi:hypothetical protein